MSVGVFVHVRVSVCATHAVCVRGNPEYITLPRNDKYVFDLGPKVCSVLML